MMHAFFLSSLFAVGLLLWAAARPGKKRHPLVGATRHEALRQLGLDERADARAVRAAHRRLMARYHPDRGGAHDIAAALNRARDVLLGN